MIEAIVSENVFLYFQPTISALRLTGAAPFSYHREKKCFIFKKSKKYILYSYGVAIILVCFCIFGLWCDVTACGKVYSRRREDIDLYINIFDVVIVSLSIIFGVLISPMKVEDLFVILQCLTKVSSASSYLLAIILCIHFIQAVLQPIDAILNEPLSALYKDRKFSMLAFTMNYIISVVEIIYESMYKLGKYSADDRLKYLRNFGHAILFFTVILTQQMAYWNIIRFVKGRIKSMNKKIEFEVLNFKELKRSGVGRDKEANKLLEEVNFNHFYGILERKLELNRFHVDAEDLTLQRLRHLMAVHEQIHSCVNSINKFFDYPILLILITCIVEMIINPWILITRAPSSIIDNWTIILWIFLRTIQLFFLIEPIQGLLVEHGKTNSFIIQLLKQAKSGPIRREAELFFMQNQSCGVEFTSLDMIPLKRNIYATVTSAVTTYLVILIQFNK